MTRIEWTEKTWNPVTGCTRVSEACQNCYAAVMANRLSGMPGGREWKEYPNAKHAGETVLLNMQKQEDYGKER